MPENERTVLIMSDKIDAITLEIEATTDKADKGIDKTIDNLKAMKTALNGISTKKLKQEMESFADFQKKLQTAFSDIKISGNTEELKKQIKQAEARLDALLSKENKLKTVSGINENSKQYRSLQYDIYEVCNALDQMYASMEKVNASKPLNFWEKPNWSENLQNYGTTDEKAIKMQLGSTEDVGKVESIASYAADNIKQSFGEITKTGETAAQSIQNIGGKMSGLRGIAEQLKTAVSGIRERLSVGSGTEKFNSDMQSLIDGMNQAKHTLNQMNTGAVAFDSSSYARAARELAEASAQMQQYKNSLTGATGETSRLKTVLSGIGGTVKGAFSKLGSIGSGIVSACKKAAGALNGLKAQIPKLGSAFSGLGKKINSVMKLFSFMVLRRAITALLNTVKQGFDNLAQYSAAKGTEFNKNISSMQSGLKQLGNSIIAAFEPLINAATPMINAFISKLIEATNVIGQFFAALTGKSTFTHAKKVVSDYAGSLDKATASAKKLATTTAGIDELNILQDNSDEGGSAGSGAADAFETVPVDSKFADIAQMIRDAWDKADFSGLGALLAGKLNDAMANIPWDAIQQTALKIARSIGTFINGFFAETDWNLVGITIGEGINTALLFANTLLQVTNWGLIGKSLAEGLNSAVNTINWQALGNLVSNGLNAIIDLLYDFATTFNFTKLGESVGTSITSAIRGIKWGKAGASLAETVNGLFETLNGLFTTTDFGALGSGIVTAIGGFFEGLSWSEIGSAISGAIQSLCDFLYGVVSTIEWGDIPQYIFDAITDFFTGFDWEGTASALGELLGGAVKGAVELMGSIWDMIQEAWGDLTDYFSGYITEAGGNIIEGLWNGITDALSDAGTWIKENVFDPFIEGFCEAFGINSPSKVMKEQGDYVVQGFIDGIVNKITDCLDSVKDWAEHVKKKFSSLINYTAWSGYASNIINGFKTKITNAYTTVKSSITTWSTSAKKWFTENCSYSKFYTIASDVISGFKEGIGALYHTCKDNIESWGSSIISWFKEKLNSNSPSKVFIGIGKDTVRGFNIGIEDEGAKTKGVMSSWADSFTDMDINLGTRLKINDSALKDYQNNYGSDFTNEAIVQRVTREVSTNGVVQATLNSGGGLKEVFAEVAKDIIIPAIERVEDQAKRQADKKEQTVVEIGGRTVTEAVVRQRSRDGFSFQPV